jgi:hypothetical protein
LKTGKTLLPCVLRCYYYVCPVFLFWQLCQDKWQVTGSTAGPNYTSTRHEATHSTVHYLYSWISVTEHKTTHTPYCTNTDFSYCYAGLRGKP